MPYTTLGHIDALNRQLPHTSPAFHQISHAMESIKPSDIQGATFAVFNQPGEHAGTLYLHTNQAAAHQRLAYTAEFW